MNAYNTYGYKSNTSLKRKPSVWNTFVRVLRATASVTCERLATVEIRTVSLVAGFILALGLVGGMECGSIPMYVGMPVRYESIRRRRPQARRRNEPFQKSL